MNFKRNVGRTDKNIRIAVGLVLIVIGILFAHSFLLTLIGAIVLATGVFSYCALYQVLGMSTATAAETVAASDDLSERANENIRDFKEEAVETANELKDKAEDFADDVREEAEEFADDAKRKYHEVREDVEDYTDDLKRKYSDKDAPDTTHNVHTTHTNPVKDDPTAPPSSKL
ncbi:MAG: DUF2892 domain-containing protein [Thiolinea sp.]